MRLQWLLQRHQWGLAFADLDVQPSQLCASDAACVSPNRTMAPEHAELYSILMSGGHARDSIPMAWHVLLADISKRASHSKCISDHS